LKKSMMSTQDTTREIEKRQIEILRGMGSEGRLRAAMELSQMSRNLLLEGVRRRHPEYDERQIRLETIRLTLPRELFLYAYPEADDILP
jgi:hypothetical protein